MLRALALWIVAACTTACFQEDLATCAAGGRGCPCQVQGECGDGLMCGNSFCMPNDCVAGTPYCACAEGECSDDTVCYQNAICLPPDELPATGGAEGEGSGDASSTVAGTGDSTGSADTAGSADSADTVAVDDTGGCGMVGASCGPCRACDATGQCAVTPGAPCEGEPVDCSTLLFGTGPVVNSVETGCYAKAGTTEPTCDAQGECSSPDPSACTEQGELLFSCAECFNNAAGCPANAPTASASVDAMCVTGQVWEGCASDCSMGTGYQFNPRWCDPEGQCTILGAPDYCSPFICDEMGCLDSCETPDDCYTLATAYDCVDGLCVMQ